MPDDVTSAARNREAQVKALFDEHYAPLCRLAWLIGGDRGRAEEVVMEAFLRTFVAWGRIRDLDNAGAYLRRAVVNQSRTRARRASTEARANADHWRRTGPARADAPMEGSDEAEVVLAAVRALPNRQRAAVVLRYYEDLSEAAIAETLRCSVGTVKSQLAKARATLTRTLGQEDEEAADA